MLFHTPTQFVVLALLLVVGWFFGLASHPGGRKWRARYEEEREAHAAYRTDAEARQVAADKRVTELERHNTTLESDRRAAAVAVPAAALSEDAPRRGAWLGSGKGDDLSRIRGIDNNLQGKLDEAGVQTFADIEALKAEDEAPLEARVGIPAGSIARDQWRDQAALLRTNRDDEWKTRFG